MPATEPQITYLKDYLPPVFHVEEVFLHFELLTDHTIVDCVMHLDRVVKSGSPDLVLSGEAMTLLEVRIDDEILPALRYEVDAEQLVIKNVPDKCILATKVQIKPHENTELSGLYLSKNNYCTQCEPHGFRRITYFLDRSDVLTTYTTTISADKKQFPMLLSNGNLMEQRDLADGRHWVKWHDPSRKPSYLFALVGGSFDCATDTFTTMSGREVRLQVYVEHGNLDQTAHAMQSLKNAMRWDEEKFGREYDLDIYMIVAVSDFNMGAMENKGLNIFNDKYILARQDTATDDDYINIESVIGHEYFHNWSGNRVTVRDWFQITLKEGLTIFRDQSFTADMTSKAVKRIADVNVIRSAQFAQDAGPMAHPIRPESYIEINNFYTVTVYNKGSEVIRMLQTMMGEETFREAMDVYFATNDGKAVTTEDFIGAMAKVSGLDLTQFQRWYAQAGTPTVNITGEYDAVAKTYTLEMSQHCVTRTGQQEKQPFHIPVAVGLLGQDGRDLPLRLKGETESIDTRVLHLTAAEQTFVFENITEQPVPSLFRHFSAPVKCHFPYDDAELLFLMQHDSDGFNQWNAAQQLGVRVFEALIAKQQAGESLDVPENYLDAFANILSNDALDPLFKAVMLTMPVVGYLIECMETVDIESIYRVKQVLRHAIAEKLKQPLLACYHSHHVVGQYEMSAQAIGQRRLKNTVLWYLQALDETEMRTLCIEQFEQADNLTDVIGAMQALNDIDCKERTELIKEFYQSRQQQHLLMDKWFGLQAISTLPNALDTVKTLMTHPKFDINNPNRVYSLIGSFAAQNYCHFHAPDGSGYQFLTDQVLAMDAKNSQVAARILQPLIRWRKFDTDRQSLMRQQLQRIASKGNLSKDVFELVSKSLAE